MENMQNSYKKFRKRTENCTRKHTSQREKSGYYILDNRIDSLNYIDLTLFEYIGNFIILKDDIQPMVSQADNYLIICRKECKMYSMKLGQFI
jgi:hypothetical protein